jgi:hypothetical protein
MGKFNKADVRTAVASPIQTERTPSGTTHQGGPGYARDTKSELFLLAVTNMVGEKTFYEDGNVRDERFERLVREVAVADPAWMIEFVIWLRNGANMRSAALIAGLEAAKALVDAKIDTTKMETSSPRLNMGQGAARLLAGAGMSRADEPGEGLAYWLQRYGVKIPKPVKRGVADAVVRLYTQRNMLKYDTASHAMRFGRVIDLVHPKPSTPVQSHLFDYAIAKMKGRDVEPSEMLRMVIANATLRCSIKLPMYADVLGHTEMLNEAGMTWEDVLSLAGKSVDKKVLWEALIPNMGYMALLRNLRNFDEAGVSDEVAARVTMRLGNPDEVLKSRQLPLRFLSAYRHAPSLRWAYALDKALNSCLKNIPQLGGRTLILIDTSGSMADAMSGRSELVRWDAATAFGLALAARCESVDVVSFSNSTRIFPTMKGESLLKSIERWKREGYFLNSGTNTVGAVQAHLTGHNRVVILTDEQLQTWGGRSMYEQVASTLDGVVPASTWLHTFNLAGYQRGHAPSGFGTRHTFGGLTDAMFPLIPLLEAGHAGVWPWEIMA